MKSLEKCFEEVFGSLRRLASDAGKSPAILCRIYHTATVSGKFRRRSPKTSSRTFLETLITKVQLITIILALFFSCNLAAANAPKRIVSLKPNITEILFALDVGDRVVGVTQFCNYPSEAQRLPKVADYTRPFIEPIITLRPDIVIGSKEESSRKAIDGLKSLNIKVELFPFTTLSETISSIRAIAKLIGKEQKGDEAVKEMHSQLNNIKKEWQGSKKSRVLIVVGRRPLIVAGPKSYIGDILSIIGAENVVAATSMPYPKWSLENIIALNPDVIIDMSMDVTKAKSQGEAMMFWQQLSTVKAIRNKRLYTFSVEQLRQSPRMIKGIRKLGTIIYADPSA